MASVLKYCFFCVMISFVTHSLISCTTAKQVVYFYDLKDTASGNLGTGQSAFENRIQKNDQLGITVGGSNSEDLIALNSGTSAALGGITTNALAGFLVEADGKIKIPYLGKLHVEGLTRLQLEDTITHLFKDYTKHPVVNVRFLNYNYSVMGEVRAPGKFTMLNERTTLLEAISAAGDLTDLGKRNNVLVVREVNGVRNFVRVNLLSKDVFKSPYFYLKTNDVVYIEPVKAKFITRNGVPQYLSIAAVGLSVLLTVINLR